MAYYIYNISMQDERDKTGRVTGFIEATTDALAITTAQSVATWADGVSGAVVTNISLSEIFSASTPANLKTTPTAGCEIEIGGNLLLSVNNPNPRKTSNIYIPSQKKSDFDPKSKRLTSAVKTAWEDELVAADAATEYFCDSNFDPFKRIVRGKERWRKTSKR